MVLARGVEAIPASVKLWMQAAQLENEDGRKKRVLRKALETVPTSVRLWKARGAVCAGVTGSVRKFSGGVDRGAAAVW